MKKMLTKVFKIATVLLISLFFQTCKKDLILPEVPKGSLLTQNVNANFTGPSYVVSTYISGTLPSGLKKIQLPYHICSAADGNMYVSSPNSGGLIYKITPSKVVVRYLPNRPNTYGIKAGQNGTIYLSAVENLRYPPSNVGSIYKIDKNKILKKIAVGLPLDSPNDLAIGPDSTIYISDNFNYRIVKVTKDGATSILAGKTGVLGLVDGKGENARFNYLSSIRYANDGTLWVLDGNGHDKGGQTIRKVTLDGRVSTFFSLKESDERFINDIAVTKRDKNFNNSPYENAFISITRSAVTDTSSATQRKHQILHLSHDGVLTPITDLLVEGYQDGDGAQARFTAPVGITVNPNGIFVTDLVNQTIRRIQKK
ncbi:hypothetical protein FFF34_016070 [Inquilinus sp. KBS0705]|nr:hypothetical protein FFF34_016070 [Inquilinus sp. KBS0705]